MKRALLLTLLAIFSFTQSTLAIDFNSLWNKFKDNQSTVFAAFGGILGITAVIGYKALQKKAIERKKMEEFVQKHPINFMFYLAPGTEYSKLDHKGKIDYLKQNNINGQWLKNKTNFLTEQELKFPFLAREKEQRILSKLTPYSGMENSNTIFDEQAQIALATKRSLADQKKPSINLNIPTNYNEEEAFRLALALSLQETPLTKNTITPIKLTPPVSGLEGKQEEEET